MSLAQTDARRPPPPFDLIVLTGFLGAGKTTLLNRLLKDPTLSDTLVLINEFGEVGVDHLLVERVDGDMIVMTSGCLCCTIRGDLVATLEDVLRRSDNGRMSPFRRVVIETTGLADPAPVLHTIMAHPYLGLRFRLHAVVTLVDAFVGDKTLDAHKEAVKQVALADRIVLTKSDLNRSGTMPLRARLQTLNPGAPILDAAAGEATAAALFAGRTYDPSALGADASAWLAAEATMNHHGHDRHHHDVNRHDAAIRAFCLCYSRSIDPAALALFLELLCAAHGANLLRLKGLVALADDPDRPAVVHGVQHIMHPIQRLDRWPDDDHRTRLVFILNELAPDFIEGLWRAAAGEPQIDEADLATRAQNPLSVVPGGLLR